MKNSVVLLLGSNMGNRLENLATAKKILQEKYDALLLKESSIYETAAWGNTNQPSFLNQVLMMETESNPDTLLKGILETENQIGRERKEKWEPRTIDIDILFFNDLILNSDKLVIPHPHLHERKFTLVPLAEIIPRWIHPVIQKSVLTLLNELNDSLEVKKFMPA